jgi:Ca2+-binding RTX toxin-like protein
MTTFTGTNGNDILPPAGSDNSGDDSFFGLDGSDTVHAGLGNDSVDLGSGNDIAFGEDGDDDLSGGADNDRLYGGNGIDHLDGGGGNDIVDGGAGADTLVGNFGNDTYYVDNVGDVITEFSASDGLDTVYSTVSYTLSQFVDNLILTGSANLDGTGNADLNKITGNSGANHLFGLGGNDVLNGLAGGDHMHGGTGNDTYYVDNAGDIVDETGGDGVDRVYSSVSFSLAPSVHVLGDVENLTLTGSANINGIGNSLNNVIAGNAGNNSMNGGNGDDTLSGAAGNDVLLGGNNNDKLNGGAGLDKLTGGAGADSLTGGLDADAFIYQATNQSTVVATGRDTIMDFSQAQGDKIDLSLIDANTTVVGNQAFTFIGSAAFSNTAGELRAQAMGTNTLLSGDVNGNGVADFSIVVKGVIPFASGDFNL